ncbi:Rho termination factor N-terminal domain-containing protein [Arthrobacter polaris]|uniref:Rho termination factor N-terminal domain-containing protein n=1 Tax=Arthrobacter polaris TaxID=2813727 RepID=UPI003899258A
MTETVTSAAAPKAADLDTTATSAPAKSAGLAGLKLAQLQILAGQLGITGGSRMRKGDLVDAISAHQRGSSVVDRPARTTAKTTENATASNGSKRGAAAKKSAEPAAELAAAGTATSVASDNLTNGDTSTAAERPARGRGRTRRAASSDGVITTGTPVVAQDTTAAAPTAAAPLPQPLCHSGERGRGTCNC